MNLDFMRFIIERMVGEQLKKMGWDESFVTDEMVENLNYVLDKYDIDTTEEIAHFLGQCMYETQNGAKLTEDGDAEYFSQYTYDIKYRGSGYIHITFEYGYKAFATYLILEKYPQLIDEKTFFRNPEHKGQDLIEEMYLRVVEKATAQNLDISEYLKIVDEGAEYLGENFAWISAGYVWYIKDINQLIADGEGSDAVSEAINNGDFDTYPLREEKYQQVYNVLTEEM